MKTLSGASELQPEDKAALSNFVSLFNGAPTAGAAAGRWPHPRHALWHRGARMPNCGAQPLLFSQRSCRCGCRRPRGGGGLGGCQEGRRQGGHSLHLQHHARRQAGHGRCAAVLHSPLAVVRGQSRSPAAGRARAQRPAQRHAVAGAPTPAACRVACWPPSAQRRPAAAGCSGSPRGRSRPLPGVVQGRLESWPGANCPCATTTPAPVPSALRLQPSRQAGSRRGARRTLA